MAAELNAQRIDLVATVYLLLPPVFVMLKVIRASMRRVK